MAQLGRFDYTVQSPLGLAVTGASVTVYREGATVNGNQSGASPTTFTVRHRGKIASADTVFINATTGTTYTATVVSATQITLSGYVGTLSLSNGDRITPSNSPPTLYGDDQGGATTANPLTSSSTGRVNCWMNTGAYDFVVSGGGATTTNFTGQVTVGEAPAATISGETDSATAVAHIEDTYFSLATAGAKLKSWRNLGTEQAAIDKDGTGIFPRLGQTSTATTGGALRFVDGNIFPLTVAGVQAALDECATIGAGTVYVPAQANILIAATPIKIPNHVALWGIGVPAASTPTFRADVNTNSTSIIENKTQDGTQQMFGLQNVHIDGGGKAVASTISKAALWCKQILSSSYIRDVRVVNVHGKGILLEGTTIAAQGPFYLENVVSGNTNDDCITVNEGTRNLIFKFIEVDYPGTGKAAMRIVATASSSAKSIGVSIDGFYSEVNEATSNILVVDAAANVSVFGFTSSVPSGSYPTTPIIVKGLGNFGGGSSGFNLRNAYIDQNGPNAILIDDQTAGVQVLNGPSGAQPFNFIQWYSSPLAVSTNGIQSQGQIIGVQYQKQGANITAAATITPLEGNYFEVDGNTNITSVTASARDKGRIITLMFNGTPTFTDGSNLKLAGNLVATADDTITLVCNGTNWYEIARSVN